MIDTVISSTTYCTDCGKPIQSDWKFCPYCAEKQKKAKCVHCKKEINAFWNCCPFCKKSLKVKSYIGKGQDGNEWVKKILGAC